MTHQDNIYNYNKALRLYIEGIQLQMDCETSNNEPQLLESIKESNQKLYDYMRDLRREL